MLLCNDSYIIATRISKPNFIVAVDEHSLIAMHKLVQHFEKYLLRADSFVSSTSSMRNLFERSVIPVSMLP